MTKPPAMPELPEPFALSLSIHDGENCKWPLLECRLLQKHPAEKQHLYTADQMRAYAIAALQSAQPAAAEFNGWYCAHCQRGVDASEVTFHEQHTVCGRVITNDAPPAPQPAAAVSDDDIYAVWTQHCQTLGTTTRQLVCAFARAVIALRPQAVPMPEWISVKDRLPQPRVEVLVAFLGIDLPSTGQYTGDQRDRFGWCYPSENLGTAPDEGDPVVTHWMPLPEAPHNFGITQRADGGEKQA